MKNQKDKRQILSSNLREFDLKEALNHAKKEKGAEVLAKNSQDMSDYILDCDQILSETTKTPFTYIYKVLKLKALCTYITVNLGSANLYVQPNY